MALDPPMLHFRHVTSNIVYLNLQKIRRNSNSSPSTPRHLYVGSGRLDEYVFALALSNVEVLASALSRVMSCIECRHQLMIVFEMGVLRLINGPISKEVSHIHIEC